MITEWTSAPSPEVLERIADYIAIEALSEGLSIEGLSGYDITPADIDYITTEYSARDELELAWVNLVVEGLVRTTFARLTEGLDLRYGWAYDGGCTRFGWHSRTAGGERFVGATRVDVLVRLVKSVAS